MRGRRRMVCDLDPRPTPTGVRPARFSGYPSWPTTRGSRPARRGWRTGTSCWRRLSAWTRTEARCRSPRLCNRPASPPAQMNRPPDVLEDPQLRERKLFTDMHHPLFDHPLPAETGPAPFRHIPPAPQRPGAAARAGHPRDLPQGPRDEQRRNRAADPGRGAVRIHRHRLAFAWRLSRKVPFMPVNPRTPVLVGYGQVNHRTMRQRRQTPPNPST